MNQRKLNLWSPLRSAQSRGPLDLVRSPLRFGRSRPRSPGPRGSPLRFGRLKAEVHWTSWGLRSASVGPGRGPPDLVDPLRPNGVFVSTRGYKLEQCGDKKTPSHMCEGVFLVVATRFELATSASRTQRSTKLSHATM